MLARIKHNAETGNKRATGIAVRWVIEIAVRLAIETEARRGIEIAALPGTDLSRPQDENGWIPEDASRPEQAIVVPEETEVARAEIVSETEVFLEVADRVILAPSAEAEGSTEAARAAAAHVAHPAWVRHAAAGDPEVVVHGAVAADAVVRAIQQHRGD